MAKKTQYVGEKIIKSLEDNTVTFKDGTTQTLTNTQLKYLVTDEKKDPTAYRELLLENICPDIVKVLSKVGSVEDNDLIKALFVIIEEHDIRKGELGPIFTSILDKYQFVVKTLFDSYNQGFNIAIGKAFGTYEEGMDSRYFSENIKVSDIKKFKNI